MNREDILSVFKELPEHGDYHLVKVKAKNDKSGVATGQTISGKLIVFGIEPDLRVMVCRSSRYIRTSNLLNAARHDNRIDFETEGGFYELTLLVEDHVGEVS